MRTGSFHGQYIFDLKIDSTFDIWHHGAVWMY